MSDAPSEIWFPPVSEADEDGLLMWGGDLTPSWLLAAYERGIFPWPYDDDDSAPVPWWSPDPRAIIEFDAFHISRRLRETIASGKFTVTRDRDFTGVLEGCSHRREADGISWLTPSLQRALLQLHLSGHAHSVECWHGGRLAGGVYGIVIGGYFSAESMFFRERDASKVALAALVSHLRERNFVLLDIQVMTDHTQSLGATEIDRAEFLARLHEALRLNVAF
jgi:leucyl/phenylalanyl-tRNA--protein transferase